MRIQDRLYINGEWDMPASRYRTYLASRHECVRCNQAALIPRRSPSV